MVQTTWAAYVAAALLALSGTVHAQSSSSVPSSMAPVSKPTASSNGVSGCVQFGDCTTGANTYKTETQYSPVVSPASHSVPDITGSAASSSYVNSLAAAGASEAYASSPFQGSTTAAPAPTTVVFDSVTKSGGQEVTTSVVNSDSTNGASMRQAAPLFVVAAVAVVGGGALVL
ncbi:hypothetical protein GLX27_002058 [Malassezia furfur]|uniref:Uncharacterized protein n=1 Tax=Malassezia furfur TaxID=55194 RepID=A0ABY8EPB0_MALFU|nr:hypothetical protein CBS14141_003627 [Malassezia furfur]WFD47407.1 hypothetical protein GLX27_002058 [Malassezia furfur]